MNAHSVPAANRVIVPLACANPEHAERLLEVLTTSPLSSRELWCWFEHYQQIQRRSREHMVDRPRLFIDTLVANTGWYAGARLRKRVATLCPLLRFPLDPKRRRRPY